MIDNHFVGKFYLAFCSSSTLRHSPYKAIDLVFKIELGHLQSFFTPGIFLFHFFSSLSDPLFFFFQVLSAFKGLFI